MHLAVARAAETERKTLLGRTKTIPKDVAKQAASVAEDLKIEARSLQEEFVKTTRCAAEIVLYLHDSQTIGPARLNN